MTIACPSFVSNTQDRANTLLISSPEKRKDAIRASDIVFLPKTYAAESEMHRYKKMEEALVLGKFVIAPDLNFDYEGLSFDGDLEDGLAYIQACTYGQLYEEIKESQNKIKERENVEVAKANLRQALEQAPFDDYVKNLDDLLDSGAFPI